MEKLKEFWLIVVDIWNKGLFGVDVGQIILAIGVSELKE